jgi:hypothetical protein
MISEAEGAVFEDMTSTEGFREACPASATVIVRSIS